MPSSVVLDNPVAFAHLQLRGGWKSIFWTTGAYFVAVVLLIMFSLRINPQKSAEIYSAWTGILLAIQAALLLLYGANTINAALRADISTGMIESHRLMPIHSLVAVGGYLLGPSAQAIGLAVVTFVIGALTTAGAQKPFATWAIANIVLGLFALFLWTIAVFTNLSAKNGFRWVVGTFIIGSVTNGMVFYLFPGMSLLVAPVISIASIIPSANRTTITLTYALAMLAQVALGVIFYLGAARKYANPNAPALSPPLGLLLLGGWVGISVAGIVYWNEFSPFRGVFGFFGGSATIQAIFSITSSMLLAATAISSASRLQAEYQRRKRIGDLSLPPRSMPTLLTVLICAAAISLFVLIMEEAATPWRNAALQTSALILVNLLSIMYVLRIMARRRAKALFIVGAFLLIIWTVPMLIDFLRHGLGDFDTPEVLGIISSASPIGAMIRLWTGEELRPVPGIYVQAALAVLLAIAYHAGGRSRSTDSPVPSA